MNTEIQEVLAWTPNQSLADQFPEMANVHILGSYENPLFHAKHVENILGLTRVHYKTDYSLDKDYVLGKARAADGKCRETILLTERGLYGLLFRSNKPIAEKFKDFVTIVIKELRLHGKVTTEKALERMNELEQKYKQQEEYSVKYYNQTFELSKQLESLKLQLSAKPPSYISSGDDFIQSFRQKYFKKVYVYLEKIPKALKDDVEEYDWEESDPPESDIRIYSLSTTVRSARLPVIETYIPPDKKVKQLNDFLSLEHGIQGYPSKYHCSLEALLNTIDEFALEES